MRKKHILVVDNEEHLANSITYALRMADYNVSTANDGREAFKIIMLSIKSNLTIDLIITDLWMPELSGLELLEELKKQKVDIPALVITATDQKKIKVELQRLGYSTYIIKPFNDKNLLDKIELVLK